MFHNFFQLQDTSRSMLSKVVLAIVFGIIAFVTVVGNIMVMVSFKMDKQLQTISNYFLFRCFCFFTLPHWNFNMSSHGQPSDCRLHNRSIFDPILHNPADREWEVAAQVFPILNFGETGKTGNYFSLSRELCDIWLSIDYMASNASVMNLLAISVDRWQNLLSSANTNISYSTTLSESIRDFTSNYKGSI